MDELIVKYLLGEIAPHELEKLRLWISENDTHKRYFEGFKFIWEKSGKVGKISDVDENVAWQNFQKLLEKNENKKVLHLRSLFYLKGAFAKVAIAATLILTFGVLYYFLSSEKTTYVATDKVLIKELSDGSVITLNKNATLTLSNSFNKEYRKVILKGECFFNVMPDKQRPFEISVNDVTVKVVGTSFNIRSNNRETKIVVETGVVSVNTDGQSVDVYPKETATIEKKSRHITVEQNDDLLYSYFRTHQFICNNTPLSELIAALNNYFDIKIKTTDSSIGSLRITTQFKNREPLEILKIITQTFNLKIEKHDKNVYILSK